MGALSRLAGSGGSDIIANTVARTGKNYVMIVVQEDTVFTTLTGTKSDGTAVDFQTVQGIDALTLKQGAIIAIPAGSKVAILTLASGSVIAYKESEQ